MYTFNFPAIQTIRTPQQQAEKILEEVKEFLETPNDEEAVDIAHSVETFLRLYFEGKREELNQQRCETIHKNRERGYYQKPVF